MPLLFHIGTRYKMLKISLELSFVIIFALALTAGCGGKKRPSDMPDIYSCQITITQENAPLEGATVLFVSDDPALAHWSVGGKTDEKGKAIMKTHAAFIGAPAGTFTVILSKEELIPNGEPKIVRGEKMTPPMTLYSLIDPKFTTKEKSPLKITIEKKKNEQTFEIGKKEKIKVGKESEMKI